MNLLFGLDCRLMDLSLEVMNSAADSFELSMIVAREGRVSFDLEFLYLSFNVRLVESYDIVVFMHLNPQYFAECRDEMVLVHDAVTFQRLVIDIFSDIAKLCYGLSL